MGACSSGPPLDAHVTAVDIEPDLSQKKIIIIKNKIIFFESEELKLDQLRQAD